MEILNLNLKSLVSAVSDKKNSPFRCLEPGEEVVFRTNKSTLRYHVSLGNGPWFLVAEKGLNGKIFEELGIEDKYSYINNIIGYLPERGGFPELNSIEDLTKVVYALKLKCAMCSKLISVDCLDNNSCGPLRATVKHLEEGPICSCDLSAFEASNDVIEIKFEEDWYTPVADKESIPELTIPHHTKTKFKNLI